MPVEEQPGDALLPDEQLDRGVDVLDVLVDAPAGVGVLVLADGAAVPTQVDGVEAQALLLEVVGEVVLEEVVAEAVDVEDGAAAGQAGDAAYHDDVDGPVPRVGHRDRRLLEALEHVRSPGPARRLRHAPHRTQPWPTPLPDRLFRMRVPQTA